MLPLLLRCLLLSTLFLLLLLLLLARARCSLPQAAALLLLLVLLFQQQYSLQIPHNQLRYIFVAPVIGMYLVSLHRSIRGQRAGG